MSTRRRDQIEKIVELSGRPASGWRNFTSNRGTSIRRRSSTRSRTKNLTLTILFGIISIVAIFLIFCIFFMIVVEKTRDIGIIKSVGATSFGVALIFLGYGVTIGLLGGGAGVAAGYLIVHNIN